VTATAALPSGYRIRPRRPDDDAALVTVERNAVELLRSYYPAIADDPFGSVEALQKLLAGHTAWVAVDNGDNPVGFAVTGPVGDYLHLHELSVDPLHGLRGIGAALVSVFIEEARQLGLEKASLTTFRDVPFNQPFYERLGFSEFSLEGAVPELRKCFLSEVPTGISVERRILMTRNC